MKVLLIGLFLLTGSAFSADFDCAQSDKEIATGMFKKTRTFNEDVITVENVKKYQLVIFKNDQFKSNIYYCIENGTPAINWSQTLDLELSEDGNNNIKCISTLDISTLKYKNCPLDQENF